VFESFRERREILPQSSLGKAARYALGQWERLDLWIDDGLIEIDNNLVENAIRPTAVGKKNWLFIGSEEAGPRAATVYTVLASCRRHGVDPFAYLRDVFTRLPAMTTSQIKDMTPAAWAKARRERAATARTRVGSSYSQTRCPWLHRTRRRHSRSGTTSMTAPVKRGST